MSEARHELTVETTNEFPECGYAGRALTPTRRFCRHPQAGRGFAVDISQCIHCPVLSYPEAIRARQTIFNEGVCQHRGDSPVRAAVVQLCCGTDVASVFQCSKHGECTEHMTIGHIKVCEHCPDHQSKDA